jgi:hypothetical protein
MASNDFAANCKVSGSAAMFLPLGRHPFQKANDSGKTLRGPQIESSYCARFSGYEAYYGKEISSANA